MTCDPCIPYRANYVPRVSTHWICPPSLLTCDPVTYPKVQRTRFFYRACLRTGYIPPTPLPLPPPLLSCDVCIPTVQPTRIMYRACLRTGHPPHPSGLRPILALQCNVPELCTERVCAPGMYPPHPLCPATHACPTVQRTRILYQACLRTRYTPRSDLRPVHALQCNVPEFRTERVCAPGIPPPSDLRPMHTLQCEFCTERVCAPTERRCDSDGLGQRHLRAGGGATA